MKTKSICVKAKGETYKEAEERNNYFYNKALEDVEKEFLDWIDSMSCKTQDFFERLKKLKKQEDEKK